MKYEKERKFVKEGMNFLKQEIIVSRITIYDVNKVENEIFSVTFIDRFGLKFRITKYDDNKYKLIRIVRDFLRD